MPEPQPIPFSSGQVSDASSLGGAPPLAVNTLIDAAKAVYPRPGIGAWPDFPATTPRSRAVTGMCAFYGRLVYLTDDGYLWAWLGPGNVMALSSAAVAASIVGYAARPSLAFTRTMLIIAAGGAPQKWDGITALSDRLAGNPDKTDGAPILTAQVAAIAQRVVLADTSASGIIYWSRPGLPETWYALDFAEAESRPDPIVAIRENTNELWAFGTQTTQAFVPDAQTGFAPLRTINQGCGAPASVIAVDDGFAWLTPRSQIWYSPGRGGESISGDIARTLDGLTATADCWGFRAVLDGWDMLVWVFPTEGRTVCYERGSKKWCEWRSFSAGEWRPFAFTSYYHWDDKTQGKDLHLVGTADGRILVMDQKYFTEDGNTIAAEIETGAMTRGTMRQKMCDVVRLSFVRGNGTAGGTEPQVELAVADDEGPWSPVILSLGNEGDRMPVVQMRPFGMYTTRRWRLRVQEQVEWSLAAAEEEFTVMGA